MSLNVANCPRCGKLYAKNAKDLCPACVKEIDLQYDKCLKYLRDNRGCTMQELTDATETPVKQIMRFIREGRINFLSSPNISYPCEVCGEPIRDQIMCDSCRQRLSKDVSNNEEDRQRAQQLEKQENSITYNIRDRLKDRLR